MQTDCQYVSAIVFAVLGTVIGSVFSIVCSAKIHHSHLGVLGAIAAGMMSGCSIVMFMESVLALGFVSGLVSVAFGVGIMSFLDYFVSKYISSASFEFSGLAGPKAIRVLILFLSLSVHSIGEGFSLGLASTIPTGSIVSLSLALHNIPEAAALSFAFKAKGVSDMHAIFFSIISTLPQSLLAFPVASYFTSVSSTVELALGVSAGCMVWAVLTEILPEANQSCGKRLSLILASSSAILLIAFDLYSHSNVR